MKIFAISDIHSFYTPMKRALDDAGFEPGNEGHLLVVCGDLFDRGNESNEVLEYIESVPNKVLIRGNHEDLFEELVFRGYPKSHDYSNGTAKTVYDLGCSSGFFSCCSIAWEKLRPILAQTVDYFETEHYVFVHGFIALNEDDSGRFSYNENWREAHEKDWAQARWCNGFSMANDGLNQTGKTVVFGHWHTSYGHAIQEGLPEFGENARFDICRFKNCIGIDACTAYSGQCNVLVVEDEPLYHRGDTDAK